MTQNEIVQLQQEIHQEIQGDVGPIASGIFGSSNKGMPDMRPVSNQQLDDLYRQKYQAGDREWLVGEAHRDPQQFLDVSQRIGVQMPPAQPDGSPVPAVPPNAFAKQAMQTAQQTPPTQTPMGPALPAVMPPPPLVAPPAAPPPALTPGVIPPQPGAPPGLG
jgi:hypothetical protein